ncbi:ComEC/Rec2 family competence protein [Clostridium carnis]
MTKEGKYNINKNIKIIVTIIIVIIAGYLGIDLTENFNGNKLDNDLIISYLDVGQGDATYIKINDYDILIDAGPKSDTDKLLSQLKEKNIDDFEIVIATHPHEDHIGGMGKIFEKYKVESFYMPKVTHTTKTFDNLVSAVSKEGLKIKTIKEGMSFDLGNKAKFDIFAPIHENYEEFNNYSPIMKLTYGNNTFIFTGDAEALSEEEVITKYPNDLKGDVLKFGHHGSNTSSIDKFIKAVSPKYGIISCGIDNKYGHPHKETLNKIKNYNIKSYRTDKQGEIILTSDGNTINFNK